MVSPERSRIRATTAVLVATALFGCTRAERPEASKLRVATAPSPPVTCGNGTQDSGEECDYSVEYKDGCPSGWEICWECDQTCQGFRLHVRDEDWGACTVHVNGRLYSRREYDAWGRNVLLEVDSDYDENFDQVARAAFDEKGQQLFWARYGEGGRLEERTDFRHDPEGRLASKLVDANGDGAPDTRWTYGYDSRSNPTQQTDSSAKRSKRASAVVSTRRAVRLHGRGTPTAMEAQTRSGTTRTIRAEA